MGWLLRYFIRLIGQCSQYTFDRAKDASVELVSSDEELLEQCNYILSIVPPRDCLDIAERISTALRSSPARSSPLYYLDLNATSPSTAQKMVSKFTDLTDSCRVIDGGIIGGPPTLKQPADGREATWDKCSIVMSGPDRLDAASLHGAELASVLNVKHVHADIGPATGLKMVFASINKGYTGMCIQAMTTAQNLGVLPELQEHLQDFSPLLAKKAENGLVNMCPKAYRWVAEMDEIAETMQVYGGFGTREKNGASAQGGDLFTSISEIFKFVADDTPLGQERIGHRKLGTTAADVAKICAENLNSKK